ARLRREEGLGSGWKDSDLDGGKDSVPGPVHWAGDVLRAAALGDSRRPDGPRRDRWAFSANVPRPPPSAQASSLISLRRPAGRDEARLRREEGRGSGWQDSDLDGGQDSEHGPDQW